MTRVRTSRSRRTGSRSEAWLLSACRGVVTDSELTCSRGRARSSWTTHADEADSGAIGEEVGGGPAPIWRVIRECANEESVTSVRLNGPVSQSAYARAGVDTSRADRAAAALVSVLRSIDPGRESRAVLGSGHYANVLRIDDRTGLALATDGVGSKVIVAGQLGRCGTG